MKEGAILSSLFAAISICPKADGYSKRNTALAYFSASPWCVISAPYPFANLQCSHNYAIGFSGPSTPIVNIVNSNIYRHITHKQADLITLERDKIETLAVMIGHQMTAAGLNLTLSMGPVAGRKTVINTVNFIDATRKSHFWGGRWEFEIQPANDTPIIPCAQVKYEAYFDNILPRLSDFGSFAIGIKMIL